MEDDNFDGWEEEQQEETSCPICELKFNASECIQHLLSCHDIDLHGIQQINKLDLYGMIRLINYLRIHKQVKIVEDDKYLVPVLKDDPLLYAFDIDSDDEDSGDLMHELEKTIARLQMQNDDLKRQYLDYQEMVKNTFMSSQVRLAANESTDLKIDDDDKSDYYFESYADAEIHEIMLKDRVRTEAYRDFIYDNKGFFKGKTVLDVGCGTGILSMFAAKAGAKAKLIAKENNLDHLITFIEGKAEDISLEEKVDVIVSEWMGYFLLFEGMLDSVLYARDKWLSDDGIMAPSRALIYLTAITDEEWYNDKCNFWNEVYGFKMQNMKDDFLKIAQVGVINKNSIMCKEALLKDIDTKTTTVEQLDFKSSFELLMDRDGVIHAFCGWFDTEFSIGNKNITVLSTSGKSEPTHWRQTCFSLQNPIKVGQGDVLKGTFECQKSTKNHRELAITIEYSCNGVSYMQNYQVR